MSPVDNIPPTQYNEVVMFWNEYIKFNLSQV